ncbi:hypothetical protein [Aestuariirhabdus litorea]|uniref:hypothetical protein n=1 Tax=Aestuariirhabdus litorea TaxID=2528527 RepID=UPI0013E37A3E|nr:hypothetical protein [Aestuariirhabdus litorea]
MSYNQLRIGRVSQTGRDYFITTLTHRRRPAFADFSAARTMPVCREILVQQLSLEA